MKRNAAIPENLDVGERVTRGFLNAFSRCSVHFSGTQTVNVDSSE